MQEHDAILRRVCQKLARESQVGTSLPGGARWLLDNYSFLRTQARDLREALSPKFWRKLARAEGGEAKSKETPRICRLAEEIARQSNSKVVVEALVPFFEDYQRTTVLSLAELWAIRPVLKLALLDAVTSVAASEALDSAAVEEQLANAITSLRAIDQVRLNDFVESISAVDRALRGDPAGTYEKMDFDSRDAYRRAVEELAERSRHTELEVAQFAVGLARQQTAAAPDQRQAHVGYYLIGPGRRELSAVVHHRPTLAGALRERALCYPSLTYVASVVVLTAVCMRVAAVLLAPEPWWILVLLVIPMSQVALQILNSVVSLAFPPRNLPRLDFANGVPDECRTFVVVPTLLLSRRGVENLLERIEIHYLANRDRNLYFGLLTDFADAPAEHSDNDDLADACAQGLRALNDRYRISGRAPFYLFHRPRLWNPAEGVWMGYERKRGKLEDFNHFLLGYSDVFCKKAGDLNAIEGIRYVITLDSDTHLPRDSAGELIGTMAHPLNQPKFNQNDVVEEGYGLLQPRVSVSMESAHRSRLAGIYSGQTGLDPYTKAVSDIYQDLFGQATYTGKGIYDLAAFDRATRTRFPDNTLLSHDLLEGEHVRVGLITNTEVIDDFPTTYEAYSKRKHRWVRGDWQIAMWLLPKVPDGAWRWRKNPLRALSRWKILDNLRRSLYEVSLVAFFLCGMFDTREALRYSLAVLAVLVLPALAQMFFSLLRFPPRRFLQAFLREVGWNFLQGLLEAALTITFVLHQALLMGDAIIRTLVRRLHTKRKLLEWESMAQAEAAGAKLSIVNIYALLCPVIATVIAFFAARSQTGYELLPIVILILWAATPMAAEFVSRRIRFERGRSVQDQRFLRELALKTWHYFVDHGRAEENWLVPDNVQFEPHAVATRSSPTNIGLQLGSSLAAYDFGYLTQLELATNLERVLNTLERLERSQGHFYNWYDTRSLEPLNPRYISTVDSGNLAASLIGIKQGCLEILETAILPAGALEGLRDHCTRLRNSVPHGSRTAPVMREIDALCRQLEYQPSDLFSLAGLLNELDKMGRPLAEHIGWLSDHARLKEGESCEEARYWMEAFNRRVHAVRELLATLTPWVSGALGLELRLSASSYRIEPLMKLLNRVPKLAELDSHYQLIAEETRAGMSAGDMVPATRRTLDDLDGVLHGCRERAQELRRSLQRIADYANRLFEEMDFRFLLDSRSNLLHIGFAVEDGKLDPSHYDLLASEARTAVFIAVAKGDIPRECWFRLGRKVTTFGGYRTLLSWSGTMFEYLMPRLYLRSFEDSLLAESAAGAVRIQQIYGRTRHVPWGISEAAYSARDANLNYQYRAFGVPVLGLSRMRPEDLVIAPYASMLALMVDPHRATANLRNMADRGWTGQYGFFESIDYSGGRPEIVRAFMVHHQGMGFLSLANTLLDNAVQRRFHAEPAVLATELLLQERLPVLVEAAETEEHLKLGAEPSRPMVEVAQES